MRPRAWILAALLAGSGCAWTRRENRPVWNAFEQHLVPADTGWFVAALPLTVPAGLGAILVDTFVAHPLQVVDDAWDDAASLWRDGRPDFTAHYYSEVAFLPVRAALTPVTFGFAFLGRSLFDIRSKEDAAQAELRQQAAARAAQDEFAAWLLGIAQGRDTRYGGRLPDAVNDAIRAAARDALARGRALGRLHVYLLAVAGYLGDAVDPVAGLRDPDPAVRFVVLRSLSADANVPPELVDALKHDPVESLRSAAAQRWP